VEPELTAHYTPVYQLDPFGNPVGLPVAEQQSAQLPSQLSGKALEGTYCRLEQLCADRHGAELFEAFAGHDSLWTYMPHGPFISVDSYRDWIASREIESDPFFYAIVDRGTQRAVGVASYLRIDPVSRSIEVGWITYSPALQRSRTATEAMYLMMRNAFALGYRRYEWKCNALNEASRKAALRLGMTYEGTFRQATVVKGRNRDSSWFSILDSEWPEMKKNFEDWLQESNFDPNGCQITSLNRMS
jgi:RimJ/RimL family protein N-acetyltransferase